jgi:hypothetical protein
VIPFCDFCLFPDPDQECPLHGPKAMKRLNEGLRRLLEHLLAEAEADS